MNEVLVARAEISDLVHTYALNVRRGKGVDCVELFSEDAVFEVREAIGGIPGEMCTRTRLAGRDDISTYLARTATPEARVCPLIHNLLISVQGGEASSTCLMMSYVWSNGHQIVGEYQDRYRYDSGWRFTSRVFTILGEFPRQP